MSGKFRVKGISPLSRFFGTPWNVLIDPMHQIFFRFCQILNQALISKVPKNSKEEFNKCLIDCMIPYESLHKPKNVSELNLWKAAGFRLFFFHLGPLIMFKSFSVVQLLVELFFRLSKAIRLLSEQKLSEAILSDAENHLNFFDNFLKAFGVDSQSFNMHTLWNLDHQCRQIRPLLLVSAFSFKSSNHLLIRTVKGSVKNPNKIVEKFLHRQNDSQEAKKINCSFYVRLSVENQEYASKNNLVQIKSCLTCGGLVYTSSSFTYNKKKYVEQCCPNYW